MLLSWPTLIPRLLAESSPPLATCRDRQAAARPAASYLRAISQVAQFGPTWRHQTLPSRRPTSAQNATVRAVFRQWLAARRQLIGASDTPAILGEGYADNGSDLPAQHRLTQTDPSARIINGCTT